MNAVCLKCGKLILQTVHCQSFAARIRGLMFSPVLPRNHALLIPSKNPSIHTFFMRFPIDVFWLDNDLRVVDLERDIRPWRPLVCPRKKSLYILEVPSVYKYNIGLNDRFCIVHVEKHSLRQLGGRGSRRARLK